MPTEARVTVPAGALSNASTLRHDITFREWVETAAVFTANQVFGEPVSTTDHAVRLKLASDIASSPSMLTDLFVAITATHPPIATAGSTANQVGEQAIVDRVTAVWTAVAQFTYPNG